MNFLPLLSQLQRASKREGTAGLLLGAVAALLLGCTPSARDVRRSDVFYERCRVLRATAPEHEAGCFQDWLRHYAREETATRIAYAEERVHLADPAAHDVLEMATGEEESTSDARPLESSEVRSDPTPRHTTGLVESELEAARVLRYQQGALRRAERLRVSSSSEGCAHCGPQYEVCFARCESPLDASCSNACRSRERVCRRGCL